MTTRRFFVLAWSLLMAWTTPAAAENRWKTIGRAAVAGDMLHFDNPLGHLGIRGLGRIGNSFSVSALRYTGTTVLMTATPTDQTCFILAVGNINRGVICPGMTWERHIGEGRFWDYPTHPYGGYGYWWNTYFPVGFVVKAVRGLDARLTVPLPTWMSNPSIVAPESAINETFLMTADERDIKERVKDILNQLPQMDKKVRRNFEKDLGGWYSRVRRRHFRALVVRYAESQVVTFSIVANGPFQPATLYNFRIDGSWSTGFKIGGPY